MIDEDEKIRDLGWDDFFESQRNQMNLDGFSVARVVVENRGIYKVKDTEGECAAKITGKKMYESKSKEDYPAVGDWVLIEKLNDEQAVIRKVLPRKSVIKRKFGDKNRAGEKSDIQMIAANIDVAFIVQSVGRDYNINRFERYLAVVRDASIEPVIIINKIDLTSPLELGSILAEIENRLGGVDVFCTSAIDEFGLEKLKDRIKKGKTYCFLGSSGVGKSSLINKLLGKSDIKTGEVGSHSKRGRHVTTKREMYFLDSGGILIDNPGIRELGMTDVGGGVGDVFGEFRALAQKCKYADCTHVHEPGCAILEAMEKGELDNDRYNNYINLKKETEYFDMSQSEKREKNRGFGKFMKNTKKEFRRIGHKDF